MSQLHDSHSRWSRIYEAMTGASAPPGPHDHDIDPPGAKPESVQAGHEPDRFDARGIIFVPVLVLATAAVAYVIVTVLFGTFEFGLPDRSKDVVGSPQAAKEADKDYNDRIANISSTSVGPEVHVHEPRLEGVRPIDSTRPGKDKPDPPYVRSFQTADKDHIQMVTPQDLYPDRYTDPLTGKKLLSAYEYVNDKKTVARIPIAEAMKLVKLQSKKGTPNTSYGNAPKNSNGGQAVGDGVTPPVAKKEEKPH